MSAPNKLEVAQVSAVINNTFSPAYPITAVGNGAVIIDTMNLSNLSFQLVDGNFKPLRLLNPMYLTLDVRPADILPYEDISQFNGKLPKDAPTPQQAEELRQKKEYEDAQMQMFQQTQATMARNQEILSQMLVKMGEKLVGDEEAEEKNNEVAQQIVENIPIEEKAEMAKLPEQLQNALIANSVGQVNQVQQIQQQAQMMESAKIQAQQAQVAQQMELQQQLEQLQDDEDYQRLIAYQKQLIETAELGL
jgi:hypothetical protein